MPGCGACRTPPVALGYRVGLERALVAVASGRSAAFKPGKELRARLNGLPAPAKPGDKPVVKTAAATVKSPAK